jgi:phosphoribosylanthranilate isomerase
VGSVVVDAGRWQQPAIRQTVAQVQKLGALSCLICLFSAPDTLRRALDYYRPDIVHFCEALGAGDDALPTARRLAELQGTLRSEFGQIRTMRSLPVHRPGALAGDTSHVLRLAHIFEPVSDFFLTDTILAARGQDDRDTEPVDGFIGITGKICDWGVARQLAAATAVPVILAGGLGPDNVTAAIRHVRPAGVDSCSATNARGPDGRLRRFEKDPARVAAFVSQVRGGGAPG